MLFFSSITIAKKHQSRFKVLPETLYNGHVTENPTLWYSLSKHYLIVWFSIFPLDIEDWVKCILHNDELLIYGFDENRRKKMITELENSSNVSFGPRPRLSHSNWHYHFMLPHGSGFLFYINGWELGGRGWEHKISKIFKLYPIMKSDIYV